ncbi:hypothetical protein ACJX0J_010824, partial [Zea mays]
MIASLTFLHNNAYIEGWIPTPVRHVCGLQPKRGKKELCYKLIIFFYFTYAIISLIRQEVEISKTTRI